MPWHVAGMQGKKGSTEPVHWGMERGRDELRKVHGRRCSVWVSREGGQDNGRRLQQKPKKGDTTFGFRIGLRMHRSCCLVHHRAQQIVEKDAPCSRPQTAQKQEGMQAEPSPSLFPMTPLCLQLCLWSLCGGFSCGVIGKGSHLWARRQGGFRT